MIHKIIIIKAWILFLCSSNAFSQQKVDTTAINDSLIEFSNKTYQTEFKELESQSLLKEYKNSIAVFYKDKYYFGNEIEKILEKAAQLKQDFLIIRDRKKILSETKNDKIRILIQIVDPGKE